MNCCIGFVRNGINLLFWLFFCNIYFVETTCAQEPLAFSDEQVLPEMSKESLFVHAKNWLKKQLGNSALEVDEIERGELNAVYYMSYDYDSKINYFVDIEVEDGRYICTLSNFEIIGNRSNGRNANYGVITREGYTIPRESMGISTAKQRRAMGQRARIFVEDYAYNFVSSLERCLRKQNVEDYRELSHTAGLVYQDSFPVRRADHKRVFELCRLWCARFFDDANENFKIKDKQQGKLHARAYLPYQCELELDNTTTAYEDDVITFSDFKGNIAYTIEMEIENDFCKMTVADFVFVGEENSIWIKDDIFCMNFDAYPEIGADFDWQVCEDLLAVAETQAEWLMGSVRRHVYAHLKENDLTYNNIYPKRMLLYRDVVDVAGKNKGELWDNALRYIRDHYESSETLPEIRDEATGELFFTSFLEYEPYALNREDNRVGIILFDIYLQVRDGAYSYSFSNFRHKAATWLRNGITLGAILKGEDCLQFDGEMGAKRRRKTCEEIKAVISERIREDRIELRESMFTK